MNELLELLDTDRLAIMATEFFPKLGAALVVLAVFYAIIRVTSATLRAVLRRAEFDEALIGFLIGDILRLSLWAVGAVMAVSQIGVNVGAAIAGLGVAGIAVGFAAQDSLANTIAGFLIFWDKPFRVGDFLTSQDNYGRVAEITMRTTRIRTMENTFVVIPNKKIIDDALVNHSMYGETRVNVPVGIAYKEHIPTAREVLLRAIADVKDVLADPEPDVVVTELGSSSVNLSVRVWIAKADFERPVFARVLEAAKLSLDDAGIQIPFPHLQLFVENVEDRVWNGLSSSSERAAS